ncbi:hypothetical protein [Clavibacter michiganensis]|uniref:hypothetical protein n=1 Tax=Clavibacter michiganensis TaxID=28447 RepID=UPI00292F5DF8|nr:hypothetical protein [Clavibacter michiganensis]
MTFLEALRVARDTDDPALYASRVKDTVRAEIESIDPTCHVENTQYFNHTAVPDFVLSWPANSRQDISGTRSVFLRPSYRALNAEKDEYYLAKTDAVVVSILPGRHIKPSAPRPSSSSRLLITDSKAFQLVAESDTREINNPLQGLVRANFIRGGKGRQNPADVARLLSIGVSDYVGASSDGIDLIAAAFTEDAVARIARTARLMELAVGDMDDASLASEGGTLSAAELRLLLPWLLQQPSNEVNAAIWSYIGGLFSFSDLEVIRDDIAGLNLSPLIKANASRWFAKRAYIGFVIAESDDTDAPNADEGTGSEVEDFEGAAAEADAVNGINQLGAPAVLAGGSTFPLWSFRAGSLSALSVELGERRLHISHLGNMLRKGRANASTATWEQVQRAAEGVRLRRVDLHGIQSSVSINAEQSPDIQGHVMRVAESLDDDYLVDAVTVRYLAPEGEEGFSDVDIDFGQGLVVAKDTASLADLTSAALGIAEYRNPASPTEVQSLLE